jgi:RND superfamily putative drug exporter
MLRHPRRTLAFALVVIAVLVSFGFSLEDRLSPSTIDIKDTPVHHANAMLTKYFGDSAPFVVLLEGPAGAIDDQGPELIRSLRQDPKVTTLSPWDRGAVELLRPKPDRAFILVDFHVDANTAVDDKVELLDQTIEKEIHSPVSGTQTGFATLSKSVEDQSISSTEHAELLALPVLLLVLLLVFRSPIAAAIPLGFGAIVVLSSRGLLALLTHFFDVSALALVVCSMMGLALGVDYALLLVSRFREELETGADSLTAAWTTRRTAGRTTIFAGSTLVLSMGVALLFVPGALLASLAGTLALVVVLTAVVATVLGPPILVLVGTNIDRWRIGPAPNGERSRLMTIVSAALKRPVAVALAISAVVLLLAAPAIALKTGPFSVGQLPKDDPAREDAERIQSAAGGGFEAPFVLIAATNNGPITDSDRLEALSRWQRRISNTPGVQSVVGPAQVTRSIEPLRKGLSGLLSSNNKVGPLSNIARLGRNLGRVSNGVALLRSGISRATYGAGIIAQGSGRLEEGAIEIAAGLGQATAGSQQALEGIHQIAKGSKQLSKALEKAALGGLRIKLASSSLAPTLNNNALPRSKKLERSLEQDSKTTVPQLQAAAQASDEKLKAALQQLEAMTVGKSDPTYAATLAALQQAAAASAPLPAELSALVTRLVEDEDQAAEVKRYLESTIGQLKELFNASKQLSDGLNKISGASKQLARGTAKLDREATKQAEQLTPAQDALSQLVNGLAQLTDGSTTLEQRLGEAYGRSYPIQSGLRRASVRVLAQGRSVNRRVANIRRTTPGIFDSGFFVLSALDGTDGRLHERASEAVDLNHGGQAATLLVIPSHPLNSPGSLTLNKRLDEDAAALSKEASLTTGVAGGPATLNTFSRVTRDRIPVIVAAITLATFLILILVLRSIPLAAIAIGLNLASVAVAFGILMLLTNVPEGWPLGGRTYIDAVSTVMIFGVVFGLSIDYAVFLLVRMREHYDKHGDNAAAIEFGLEKTARVITGAAVIMMAVFIAFAGAPIATVSQLGVGLTVAVILDATVVRIVLLPALMLLVGDKVWWLPRSLDRVLPRLNV